MGKIEDSRAARFSINLKKNLYSVLCPVTSCGFVFLFFSFLFCSLNPWQMQSVTSASVTFN